MAERTSITQITNVGVEATPGTTVPANKRLQALSIDPSVSAEIDTFRPSGQKFHALQSVNKESVEASISGKPTFTEIIYPLASVLTKATPTVDAGVSTYSFTPANAVDDQPLTLTVEKGSNVRAHRFNYGLVTELNLNFSRDAIELDGSMIGRILTDAVTLTSSPTAVDLVPVLPSQTSIFLDDDSADLGSTKLLRVIGCDISIGDRFNPAWFLDAAEPSWAVHVEGEPSVTATLRLEADAQGMELLSVMREGSTRFLRVQAVGPEIASTGEDHSLTIDLAGKVEEIGEFSDEDGIYAIEYTLRAVYDSTWAKALEIAVVNGLATY